MRALSIRQPYAEQILRGIPPRRICDKTIEYRSRPTRIIGERFLIYAAKPKTATEHAEIQRLLRARHEGVKECTPGGEGVKSNGTVHPLTPSPTHPLNSLPTGVIVGTAVITHVTNGGTGPFAYEWHLTDVRRLPKPRKPKGRPQPVWFRPF